MFVAKRRNRGNIRKKTAEDEQTGQDDLVLAPKRQARSRQEGDAGQGAEHRPFAFDSNNALQQQSDGGATRALETETATDRDGRSVGEPGGSRRLFFMNGACDVWSRGLTIGGLGNEVVRAFCAFSTVRA